MSTPVSASLPLQDFQRKPFDVRGLQVTEENFEEVAAWCGGSIVTIQENEKALDGSNQKRYIQVDVSRPLSARQSQGHVGDWILYSFASKSYKVYTDRAFRKSFEPKPKEFVPEMKESDDEPQELLVTNKPAYVQDNSTVPPTIKPENHQDGEPAPIAHEAGVSGPDTVAGGNWGGHE